MAFVLIDDEKVMLSAELMSRLGQDACIMHYEITFL
jgi:hypothetical protein